MNILKPIADSLNFRQLRAAVHVTGFVIMMSIVAVGYGLFFHTAGDEIAAWTNTIHADEQVIATRNSILAGRDMAECELYAMTMRLEQLTDMIPNTPQESLFLAQLSNLAETSQLEINNFRPGPPEVSENVRRIRVLLSGTGTYQCFCQFLDGLRSLPRLTHVSKLQVDPVNADSVYPVTMELSIFFAANTPATKVASNDKN